MTKFRCPKFVPEFLLLNAWGLNLRLSLYNITAPRVISTVIVAVRFTLITFNLPLLNRSKNLSSYRNRWTSFTTFKRIFRNNTIYNSRPSISRCIHVDCEVDTLSVNIVRHQSRSISKEPQTSITLSNLNIVAAMQQRKLKHQSQREISP